MYEGGRPPPKQCTRVRGPPPNRCTGGRVPPLNIVQGGRVPPLNDVQGGGVPHQLYVCVCMRFQKQDGKQTVNNVDGYRRL